MIIERLQILKLMILGFCFGIIIGGFFGLRINTLKFFEKNSSFISCDWINGVSTIHGKLEPMIIQDCHFQFPKLKFESNGIK